MTRFIRTGRGTADVGAIRGEQGAAGRTTARRVAVQLAVVAGLLLLAGCGALRRLNLPLLGPRGPYDLVITGGTVVDGTGAPGYRADVAVVGDRIVRISKRSLAHARAKWVIDATGRVVAPGFVDLHEHLDGLPRDPDATNMVRQGVTSALGGVDGRSPLPLFLALDTLRRTRVAMNVGYLVGQAAVRRRVMGDADRPASLAELDAMRRLVAQAMHDGARGLSADLAQSPGRAATTTEVVALAEVAGDSGGIFAVGARRQARLANGVAEALEIGRRAAVPVLFTRVRVVGAPDWGSSARILAVVDSARTAGETVWLDQVPTDDTPASITALVPEWAMQGGRAAFLDRLWQPALRDSIFDGIKSAIINGPGGNDLRRIELVHVPWRPELDGKTLYDWAVAHHVEPVPEAGAELVIQAIQRGGARVVLHDMSEDDIVRSMKDPHTAIVSDGRVPPDGAAAGGPNPRDTLVASDGRAMPRAASEATSVRRPSDYGAFPHMLGHYVRQRHVLPLEAAVHRMTGLPAAIAGFDHRGRIAEGWFADLVVFDSATVAGATDANPARPPTGIDWVIVNGTVEMHAGRPTGQRAGVILERPAGTTRLHPAAGRPRGP
ncbi:MAG: amidohydrolase family protein [Gemmatimonadota bacterium]